MKVFIQFGSLGSGLKTVIKQLTATARYGLFYPLSRLIPAPDVRPKPLPNPSPPCARLVVR